MVGHRAWQGAGLLSMLRHAWPTHGLGRCQGRGPGPQLQALCSRSLPCPPATAPPAPACRPVPRRERPGAHGVSGGGRAGHHGAQQHHAPRGRADPDSPLCRVGRGEGSPAEPAGEADPPAHRHPHRPVACGQWVGAASRAAAASDAVGPQPQRGVGARRGGRHGAGGRAAGGHATCPPCAPALPPSGAVQRVHQGWVQQV